MSNFNIKVGGKVYYPRGSNKILTTKDNPCESYPIFVRGDIGAIAFTSDGKIFTVDSNPSVFPATQEWYEKLVQTYPDLEPPAKRKEPIEIIKEMLESGWYRVPVFADGHFFFVSSTFEYTKKDWQSFYPFDLKTGKAIIDFVDGKVVLED